MATHRIAAFAAVVALALGGTAALAQNGGSQPDQGEAQTQQRDQTMPRGGMMSPGQGMMGQGMMGQGMMGQGRMGQGMHGPGQGQGQGMYGPGGQGGYGMRGQGMTGPGMMQGGPMYPGMMHHGPMHPGMRHDGKAGAGPTLKIETPGGLSFTCNAPMQACLQAFDRVRAAGRGGDGAGN